MVKSGYKVALSLTDYANLNCKEIGNSSGIWLSH